MPFYSTTIFYISTIFITITRIIFRLQTQHASMCSACNHFLQNKPFYSTTIFITIIRDLRLQPVHASMCSACNHCLQTCLFTVLLFFLHYYYFITITRIIFRVQTQHASMCSACNHFLKIYFFYKHALYSNTILCKIIRNLLFPTRPCIDVLCM